jgi:hypothetical protein
MFEVNQKVTLDNETNAEVVKVLKNGMVKISFWVQSGFMIKPELWTDTVKAKRLTAR